MKKVLALLLAFMMVFSLAACGGGDDSSQDGANPPGEETLKVGFVYVGSIGDEGWSQAHNEARTALETTTGVETIYVENVPENADCEKTIRDLIDQGCTVIFTTSYGFMEWTANVAADHPEVKFLHCSGYTTAENMTAYFGRIYQARYLSGIAAGMKTESNKIGYVAAFPIPEVIRGINAFTLGVRSVNPDATVEVLWTSNWGDSALAKQAALDLIGRGCDVIAQHQDTTASQIAAGEEGVFCVGYNYATPNVAPDAYLGAPVWNWAPYYIAQIEAIKAGTWTSENYWGGTRDGIVDIDLSSVNCAEGTAEAVADAKARIMEGYEVFTGPINDNAGNLKVEEGIQMTDEELLNFDWFVDGVVTTLPES